MSDLSDLIREHSPHAKADRAAYERELMRIVNDPELMRLHQERVESEMKRFRENPEYTREWRHLRDIVFT